MSRMKGMHGVCTHPGRSFIELKVRAYNRTPFVQSFLWWANVATRVKMSQTSNVYAVALTADNKAFFAQKEVKVTLGGCGG